VFQVSLVARGAGAGADRDAIETAASRLDANDSATDAVNPCRNAYAELNAFNQHRNACAQRNADTCARLEPHGDRDKTAACPDR
jgi:hypothetical protein